MSHLMSYLTDVLYWISTGALAPVIIILIIAFARALLLIGGFYGLYMNRLKLKVRVARLLDGVRTGAIGKDDLSEYAGAGGLFTTHLERLIAAQWHPAHCRKVISDMELAAEKELEVSKTLMRVGPMLGLMGTLIPMGPALVGLAAGDIASMAMNMQIAFSTTVVGLLIGGIGYVTQLVKRRWFVEDLQNLQYLHELFGGKESTC